MDRRCFWKWERRKERDAAETATGGAYRSVGKHGIRAGMLLLSSTFFVIVWAMMVTWSPATLAARRTNRKHRGRTIRTGSDGMRSGRQRRGWDWDRGAAEAAVSRRPDRSVPGPSRSALRPGLSVRQAARRARIAARAVSRALAQFEWEPSVQEVQRRALAVARLHRPGITQSRIRGAAALPELRVGVDMGRLQGSTSRREAGSPVRLTDRLDADRTWSLEAKWSLHRLIFDPNELKLESQRIKKRELRDEILAQVTRLYFLRRRIQALEILQPARTVRTALGRRLAIERLTGELDSLTGGWFSASLRRRSRR